MNSVVPINPLPYPLLKDELFQKKIALKKQFQLKYDATEKNMSDKTAQDEICFPQQFTLAPYQEFVKTFISFHTPYNGLLLYHGMGSGKTCSVIGITEAHRKYNKLNKNYKKILIITSPNVQSNFRLQLFDPSKLIRKNNIWNLDSCVGPEILQELSYYNIQNISREGIMKLITSKIMKNYEFMGYEKFGNSIIKMMEKMKTSKASEKSIKRMFREKFSGRMIVVDEVHNIRVVESGNKDGKIVANGFQILLKYVQHMKLLFLSGTPMYNNPREIIFIINLLNMNDKQGILKTNDVFDKEDQFVVKNGQDTGKELLKAKSNGYISYVRGENPYAFPFKVFPSLFDTSKSMRHQEYPSLQFNRVPIEQPLQHLDLYVNQLSSQQSKGYRAIIERVEESFEPALVQLFEEDSNEEDAKTKKKRSLNNTHIQEALHALTMCVFNESKNSVLVGKHAVDHLLDYNSALKQYNYSDKTRPFHIDSIGLYSAKIESILRKIKDCDGIVLIYSQFLDSGLIPIALALEANGYGRLSSREKNFMSSEFVSQNGSNTYAMITGDNRYSKSNKDEISIINKENNSDGSRCKVVLISQAGSEGIDFKNLRQVHVVDPWYNLNRTDQIIGRAIRHCSHKNLPLRERNCQIFLHASRIEDDERETIDMFMYRHAEQKSIKIGNVQKLLKSVSVDCLLNQSQTSFSRYEQTIKIKLSDKKEIEFNLKDEDYTPICDYGICGHQCLHRIDEADKIDDSSYHYDHDLRPKLIHQIKQLFQKQHVFKKKQLIEILESNSVSVGHIYHALTYLIENKHELLIDKFSRKGRLHNIKDLYFFKPVETDSKMSIEDLSKPFRNPTGEIGELFFQSSNKNNTNSDENSNVPNKVVGLLEASVNKSTPVSAPFDSAFDYVSTRYNTGMTPQNITPTKDSDFYDIYRSSIDLFKKSYTENPTIFTETMIRQTLTHHILESLSAKHELLLIQKILRAKDETLTDLEKQIKQYFKSYYFRIGNEDVYFLVDLKKKYKKDMKIQKNKLPEFVVPYVYDNDKNKFIEMNRTMKHKLGFENIMGLIERLSDSLSLNQKFAFMDYSIKDDTFFLKIMKLKSHRGAMFSQKIPKLMKIELNSFLDPISSTGFFKLDTKRDFGPETMTVLFEYITHSLHENKKSNAYYLNKLLFVSYQLKKLN